jgi:hypothetical protein
MTFRRVRRTDHDFLRFEKVHLTGFGLALYSNSKPSCAWRLREKLFINLRKLCLSENTVIVYDRRISRHSKFIVLPLTF